MAKNVIMATGSGDGRPAFFLGYRRSLDALEGEWTSDPWSALWLDEDEAAIEAILLADLCPGYEITRLPLARVHTTGGR